ncbi:MAG: TlpA family protein disulfide reductase [Fibromonadaceae bacterium]|nr:TlpA family protein disulfide reductase [Fibromonadaceae bacterium]
MRVAIILTVLMSALCFGQLQGTIPNFQTLTIENEPGLTRDNLKEKAKKTGAKRIALSFFATWCVNCVEEFALLKKNADELQKNGVQVYLIDVGESIHKDGEKVSDMVNKYAGNSFPLYFDPNGNLLRKSGFLQKDDRFSLPLIIVLDTDLKVLSVLSAVNKENFPQILWGEL